MVNDCGVALAPQTTLILLLVHQATVNRLIVNRVLGQLIVEGGVLWWIHAHLELCADAEGRPNLAQPSIVFLPLMGVARGEFKSTTAS